MMLENTGCDVEESGVRCSEVDGMWRRYEWKVRGKRGKLGRRIEREKKMELWIVRKYGMEEWNANMVEEKWR